MFHPIGFEGRIAIEEKRIEADELELSPDTICRLHALSHPGIWGSGKFKEKSEDVIEKYADGSSRVRSNNFCGRLTPRIV